MPVVAFDAKEFKRSRIVKDEQRPEASQKREVVFFTPLGAGIVAEETNEYKKEYVEKLSALVRSFEVPSRRIAYCSAVLRQEIGQRRAIPFCDQLLQQLQGHISSIFLSYVVLPPKEIPFVEVGGYRSPRREIETHEFLRSLCPTFSYMTAWSFFSRPRPEGYNVFIDDFRSRETYAWDELLGRVEPRIFPRGDECNPYLSLADMVAFLTDVKLWINKRNLKPENVKEVWKDYDFEVEVRFLDEKSLGKYKWRSDDHIDSTPYLARPMTFLLVDEIEKLGVSSLSAVSVEANSQEAKPRRFHEVIRKMDPYFSTAAYAFYRGGGTQFFDKYLDSSKVKDGDTLVYIGPDSKKVALTFQDAFEVEVLSAKELRKRVEKEFSPLVSR